jgi:cytochrome c oxidase assembly protein subunit 15
MKSSDLISPSTEAIRRSDRPVGPWPHRLALLAAALTWPLLLVGGTVTVYRVGMAVPDWPTTFGSNMFLYNMFEAPWGVFAEHAHRLYASIVGFSCIGLAGVYSVSRLGRRGLLMFAAAALAALAAAALHADRLLGLPPFLAALTVVVVSSVGFAVWAAFLRRDLPLSLAWLALAAVVGLGVLGGYRVRMNSTHFAFIHGSAAQAFFGLLVVLCIVTGPRWAITRFSWERPAAARRFGIALLAFVAAQIVLGAAVRHYGSLATVLIHAALAVVVLGLAIAICTLSEIRYAGFDDLLGTARVIALGCAAQLALGGAAWWILRPFDGIPRDVTSVQALIRIAHQGVGALLLAASLTWLLHSFRSPLAVARRAVALELPFPARATLEAAT